MKTRILSVVLALLLCIGCLGSVAFADVSYPIDTDTALTLWKVLDGSIVDAGYKSSQETPGFKEWQRATGVNVELKEFADNTALVLAIQADALPDMIMLDPTAYTGGILGMANDGLIIEITDEMAAQNAPDYWAYINSMDAYMKQIRQLDGKMYGFASHVFPENSIYRFWKGFIYRQDILDANGLSLPNSNQEFKDLLIALRDNVDGIVTPWTFNKDEFPNVLTSGYITSEYDLVNTAWYQVDGKMHFGAYEAAYKDVLTFLKELYDEKLISEDFATMDEATAQSMLLQGQSAVLFGNNSRLNTLAKSLPEGGVITGGPVLHRPDQDKALYSFADNYVTNGDWTYISADSQNAELCLQFLNYVFTEQGNLLRNFGIEGESFEMVDGEPVYTDLVKNNPNGYSLDAVARSYALVNWPGIHADVQNRQRHPSQSQVDAYMIWSDTDFDKYNPIYTAVMDEYLDEYTDMWTDIDTYVKECRVKFISGQMSLENDFDAYIAHLKEMGMDRVIEIKQLTWDAYAAANE